MLSLQLLVSPLQLVQVSHRVQERVLLGAQAAVLCTQLISGYNLLAKLPSRVLQLEPECPGLPIRLPARSGQRRSLARDPVQKLLLLVLIAVQRQSRNSIWVAIQRGRWR